MAKRKPTPSAPESTETPTKANSPEYTVLARRYRPQQFGDLVGQEPVVQALRNALTSNRVAHAYLFTGARGVGKTSTARILAKALNCAKGPTADPCGECSICLSIASGEDVDVLEIDGASNRGIDEVREIRQNVQYRPTRCRYKIYIVDEVHMLTAPAFNALLKTLEEPPAHVKFIFATTEVQKIPITILSRCQRFDFAGIGTPRIVERLREVVAGEKMQADDDALELIARRAGGSMRDAQSLLDQVLAFGGQRLTTDQVHQLLGTAHDDRVSDLASAVIARDARKALEILARAADLGLQLSELLDQMMDYWRDLMVVNCSGSAAPGVGVPARLRETLSEQAATVGLDTLLAGLDVLATAKTRLRSSGMARTLLEIAVVRLCRLEDFLALSELSQSLDQRMPAKVPPKTGSPMMNPGPAAEPVKKKLTEAFDTSQPANSSKLDEQSLPRIWGELVRLVGPFLGKTLEVAGLPAISGPNVLVIRFASQYNSQCGHAQQPANVARVEEILRRITGLGINLRVELAGGTGIIPSAVPGEDDAGATISPYKRQRSEALKEPLVKKAMEVLGAQVVEVDEGFGSVPQTLDDATVETEEN